MGPLPNWLDGWFEQKKNFLEIVEELTLEQFPSWTRVPRFFLDSNRSDLTIYAPHLVLVYLAYWRPFQNIRQKLKMIYRTKNWNAN